MAAALPLLKLSTLLVKTIAKPVAGMCYSIVDWFGDVGLFGI